MRVIETFVTSVPRENIRPTANYFVQDYSNYNEHALSQHSAAQEPQECSPGCWYSEGYIPGTQVKAPLSSDAAETVVTREELMRAYDLVEQGYTLWFGGECPVDGNLRVDFYVVRHDFLYNRTAKEVNWSNSSLVAYRLSRSVDKDVAAVNRVANARDAAPLVELDHADTIIAAVIEANLKGRLATGVTDATSFPRLTGEQACFSLDGRISANGDNLVIISRKQWDDYVNRKIRVGDKVKTDRNNVVTVLFIGEKTAFVKFQSGAEIAINLNRLTRIPQ